MLLEQEQTEFGQTVHLGPARVVQTVGRRLRIDPGDGPVWADLALGYPYEPAAGDSVLVISQGDDWYVIGVLRGSAPTTLSVPGDLRIAAPHGRIELSAGQGICLRGPTVRIVARKLAVLARSVLERFTSATRWVTEAFHVRAGRVQTSVAGSYRVRAGKITERAQGDFKIDGRKIHLS